MGSLGQPTFISEFATVVEKFYIERTQDAYANLIAMAAAHMREPNCSLREALDDISSSLEVYGALERMADQIFDDIRRVIRGEPISVVEIKEEPNP